VDEQEHLALEDIPQSIRGRERPGPRRRAHAAGRNTRAMASDGERGLCSDRPSGLVERRGPGIEALSAAGHLDTVAGEQPIKSNHKGGSLKKAWSEPRRGALPLPSGVLRLLNVSIILAGFH